VPGRRKRRVMSAGVVLMVAALAVAASGSLIPISGTDIGPSAVDVSCGSALGTVTGWPGPKAGEADDTIMLGVDYGTTKAVWCGSEAGRWLRPFYGVSAAVRSAGACMLRGGAPSTQAPGPGLHTYPWFGDPVGVRTSLHSAARLGRARSSGTACRIPKGRSQALAMVSHAMSGHHA
jgi:hypothetical protein